MQERSLSTHLAPLPVSGAVGDGTDSRMINISWISIFIIRCFSKMLTLPAKFLIFATALIPYILAMCDATMYSRFTQTVSFVNCSLRTRHKYFKFPNIKILIAKLQLKTFTAIWTLLILETKCFHLHLYKVHEWYTEKLATCQLCLYQFLILCWWIRISKMFPLKPETENMS